MTFRKVAVAAAVTIAAAGGALVGQSFDGAESAATTSTVTVRPVADARVQESSPSTNYGTQSLRTDGGAGVRQQLAIRFNVQVSGQIVGATLRLRDSDDPTANGPQVFKVGTNNWAEDTVTWANRPLTTGGPLADVGAVAAGAWASWNVSPIITGDGTYSFKLLQDSTDGTRFNSRESTSPPELVLQVETPSTTTTTTTTTPTGAGYPSLTGYEFDGDFDSGCSLTSGQGAWNRNLSGSDYPGTASIERSIVAEGSCSAKLVAIGSSTGRAELEKSASSPDPNVLYEGLFYVPSSSPPVGAFIQHKQAGCFDGGFSNDSGSDLLLFAVSRCTSPPSAGQTRYTLGSYPRNAWWALKVRAKFSNSPPGSFQVWVDPDGPGPGAYQQRLPLSYVDNESGSSNGGTVRFRVGSYSRGASSNRTIYSDGFRMDTSPPSTPELSTPSPLGG